MGVTTATPDELKKERQGQARSRPCELVTLNPNLIQQGLKRDRAAAGADCGTGSICYARGLHLDSRLCQPCWCPRKRNPPEQKAVCRYRSSLSLCFSFARGFRKFQCWKLTWTYLHLRLGQLWLSLDSFIEGVCLG